MAQNGRPAFFTPAELARYLGVSIRTVRQLLSDGDMPSYTFAGARRISVEDVDHYVSASRHEHARRLA